MQKLKQTVERRKFQRFRAQDGAYAVFGPDSRMIGQIIDISMGGLAFSYMPSAEPGQEQSQINIFLAEKSFYLKEIPFDTVWDSETRNVPFSSIEVRRAGVEFGQLDGSQSSELEYFIEHYTAGRA